MDTQESLDIKQALTTIADYLNMDAQKVAANVCLFDETKMAKLVAASEEWNRFESADIETRGQMLGINITVEDRPNT